MSVCIHVISIVLSGEKMGNMKSSIQVYIFRKHLSYQRAVLDLCDFFLYFLLTVHFKLLLTPSPYKYHCISCKFKVFTGTLINEITDNKNLYSFQALVPNRFACFFSTG